MPSLRAKRAHRYAGTMEALPKGSSQKAATLGTASTTSAAVT